MTNPVLLPDDDIAAALELVRVTREKAQAENEALRKEMRQVAQMVHQAYHDDIPGTWEECPRGVCQRVSHTLKNPLPIY